MKETIEVRVRTLGWEDPLEKGMATHSNIFAWRIPWAEEPGRIWSIGSHRVGYMHTHPWIWPGITGIPFFFFNKFCERATLVSVFDWWKKPEEDSWRGVNFAFSICFAASTRKVAHTQSREWPPQAPFPETILSLSGSGHQSSDQASVLDIDLYGASLSKMCPRVIASSPHTVSVYKAFVGTFSFRTAGKPLFSGTFSLSATLVSLLSPW